jgi:2-keto-4-pentenoate hydratase/2-oxohepta-3-ene-1,7-dioic acid hydratase in catechol pathway
MREATVLPTNEKIAINDVFLIGKNYIEDPVERVKAAAGTPVVCLKPRSAIIFEGEPIQLPAFSAQVNFEIELLILIGKGGKHIPKSLALGHVLGYGVGLDLTAHDLHQQAKTQGLPWTLCKGFDTAAPLSAFIAAERVAAPEGAVFHLDVNGERRQNGDASRMAFGIPDIISYLSTVFTLQRGDVIYTGTPAGAGPLVRGDRLRLDYEGLVTASFEVAVS